MSKRQRKRPTAIPPIRTFEDAVCEGFALSESFKQAQTAALLDDDGHILDMTVFSRDVHTVDVALDWAHCMLCNIEGIARIVLFSITKQPVEDIKEDDIRTFEAAREVFRREWDVDLLDWIQCDGDQMRSLAFTLSKDAWEYDGTDIEA